MNAKENTLRAIRRGHVAGQVAGKPEWVPYGLEGVVVIWSPIVCRTREPGLDAFGVEWSLEEELLNAMTDEIATYGRAAYAGGMTTEQSEGDTHATT
jgi:hypothetical protein